MILRLPLNLSLRTGGGGGVWDALWEELGHRRELIIGAVEEVGGCYVIAYLWCWQRMWLY
jgi:hypothetical protein